MKKLLLIAFTLSVSNFGIAQATNFTTTDCNSNSHDLFTELNSGTVVVLTWVMPCAACINAASTAATTVQGYASSNPGRVKFYLVDDIGDASCSTLTSWASTNSIITDAVFSNSGNVINMTDYGTSGMPKTIVIGGSTQSLFLNVNGTVTTSSLQSAINSALVTGISENTNGDFQTSTFPNPANSSNTTLTYVLKQNSNVNISMYNVLGENVKNITNETQSAGKHQTTIYTESLSNGIYFIKIKSRETAQTVKFTVDR